MKHSKGSVTRTAVGALSSVGRASGLQPEGRGFKSPSVHHHETITRFALAAFFFAWDLAR